MPYRRDIDDRAICCASALLGAMVVLVWHASPTAAQLISTGPMELSDAVQVDEADSPARSQLERAKSQIAEKQWDDAIETLRQAMSQGGERLVQLDSHRFAAVGDYCQMLLAALPPDGLALYRGRVDALAKRAYEQGVAERDPKLLERVVNEMFASSYGAKALSALGEIELERGNFSRARWCWQRINPSAAEAPDTAKALNGSASGAAEKNAAEKNPAEKIAAKLQPVYPDSQIPLAEIRARLALVSIMEGSLDRARREIAELDRLHPGATGRMAGKDGPLSDALRQLVKQAEARPAPPAQTDWPTFAGSPQRTAHAAARYGLGTPVWETPLAERPIGADLAIVRDPQFRLPEFRVGEDQRGLLPFYPQVADNLVLFCRTDKVFAFDLHSGKPAWPVENGDSEREPGEIYSVGKSLSFPPDVVGGRTVYHAYGAPRFTMTVKDHRLYARLGSPITAHPVAADQPYLGGGSALVCLDLNAQGYLRWRVMADGPEDDRWACEGAPV